MLSLSFSSLLTSLCGLAVTTLLAAGAPAAHAQAPDAEQRAAREKLRSQGLSYSKEAFFEAAEAGRTEDVKTFLRAGMDASATTEDERPMVSGGAETLRVPVLLAAVRSGAPPALIRALLDAGADPEAAVRTPADRAVTTALAEAAGGGHRVVLALLLDEGAAPNAPMEGNITPVMAAAVMGHAAEATLLLDAGADPNARAVGGTTALMIAADEGHIETARALLGAGADPSLRDEDDRTARAMAEANGHADVVRLLETAVPPDAE